MNKWDAKCRDEDTNQPGSCTMKTRFDHLRKAALRQTSRFARNDSGALALIVGLAAIPFFVAGGIALDTFRAGTARADVQASLDAAALAAAAAGPSASDADRKKMAEQAFETNIEGSLLGNTVGKPDINFSNGAVTVSYQGSIPTTLMKIGGFNSMQVTGSSTATLRLPQKAEIALVLDYSGSMEEISAGKVKYQTMKDAAIDMVNGLTENGSNEEVLFSLVPFSHNVFTSLPSSMVLGASGGSWTGCTYDRQYPHNTKVNAPTGAAKSKWGQPAPTSYADYAGQQNYHCDGYNHDGNGYQANSLVVQELSKDHSSTISQLKAMKPYGYTNISLGLSFGWQTVDPGAPFAARPDSDKKNKKFIVLLTDGKQTTPAFGPGNSRDRYDGEANLEKICANLKNTEITVITIAFALGNDTGTENRLKNCSTDPDKHFFEAEDSNDLTKAFEQIKNQIASAIYLSQ
jgi:Flp pilus assembly protein TadG